MVIFLMEQDSAGEKKDDIAKRRMEHPRRGVKISVKYFFSCVRGRLLKLFG